MAKVSSPSGFSKLALRLFSASAVAIKAGGRRRLSATAVAVLCAGVFAGAQVPGRNVNMVSGTRLPDGDPYLQRQNEPSVAASTRNPLHLLAGANDYRTVDLPGLPGDHEVGDAWMGLFKSFDGGSRWSSTLVPGYPQDNSAHGKASPLKGYTAAADPVVRAGTNGLFYYSGIVFNRGEDAGTGPSAMFVARYIDHNTDGRDTIAYVGTTMIETSNDQTVFIDKPWFATDVPRAGAGTCTITSTAPGASDAITQTIPAGAAYAVFSKITTIGDDTKSQVFFKRSDNCGETWSPAIQLSSSADPINQGATLAIDPRTGTVYVAWRRFTADGTDDSIMVVRSLDQGRKWDPPGRARRIARGKAIGLKTEVHGKKFTRPSTLADLSSLDQGTLADRFRSNAYPSMTVDDQGRIYIVWAERGFSPYNPNPDDGDARVLLTTSRNGAAWTEPVAVDNPMTIAINGGQGHAIPGHQLMPTISFAGGKLMLAYYDFRFDVSNTWAKWIDEGDALFDPITHQPRPNARRHTVDVRAVQGSPGDIPVFGPSVQVSEYLVGRPGNNNQGLPVQLQFNPPNLPLFKLGEVPFMGDYIDLTPSPAFVTGVDGTWMFNTAPTSSPLFHVVWTDNRDVVPPAPPKTWKNYTPPTQVEVNSMFPIAPQCAAGTAGMRNQNIYTARLTGGIVAGAPDNSKSLHPTVPRAFALYAQNTTEQARIFRLAIHNQPAGGRASFTQVVGSATPEPYTSLDVAVARRSTIARTVYVTSTEPAAQVHVSVTEIAAVGAPADAGASQTVVVLNPDISNPDISNPDISNPDISNPDISNPDISNPDISNPDISNPDISNPDISNPDISNPDISNVQVANPDISNPDISNPDISNPDISNPDISNPDISNPDISNQSLTDTSWTLTNNGNTPVSYDVQLLLNGEVPEDGIVVQMILHKTYVTPAVIGCSLVEHTTNVLLANILKPQFSSASAAPAPPDPLNPDVRNATLLLGSGESARITLRVLDENIHDEHIFNAAAQVTPAVVSQPQYLIGGMLQHTVTQETPSSRLTVLHVPTAGSVVNPVDAVIIGATDANGSPAAAAPIELSLYRLGSIAPLPLGTDPPSTKLTSTANVGGLAAFTLPPFTMPGTYHVIASWATGGSVVRVQSSNFAISAVAQWSTAARGNGNFYEYVQTPGLSWTEARTAAAARRHNGIVGRLVTIANAAENQFVSSLRGTEPMRAWIGLYDPDGTDPRGFEWISGEPDTYRPWAPGEPNNPGTEFWVEMFTEGTWNNNVVSDPIYPTLGYVVEYVPTVANFLVTSTADSGPGSLRQAILSANANGASSADEIGFAIPSGGPHFISLASPLPAITQPVSINGTTQPGYDGAPIVFIDGADAGTTPGLRVQAPGTEIRGLAIVGFLRAGIQLWSGGNGVVRGNYIGLTGGEPASGNGTGIEIHSAGNVIGGVTAADRNVISGNQAGIFLISSSSSTVIVGNYIGTDPAGTATLSNSTGIVGDDAGGARIGGTESGARNVISGNTTGIRFTGTAGNNQILHNYIGVDVTGSVALGNSTFGIHFTGNAINNVFDGNTIAFNGAAGLLFVNEGQGNSILLNSFHDNGGLGIDHGFAGVTGNDPTEIDGIQNYPVLTSAVNGATGTRVQGTLTSTPSASFQIRVFVSPTCDPDGFGEGRLQVATIDGVMTDGSGQLVIDSTITPTLTLGQVVTATARNLVTNNTSEFSGCRTVQSSVVAIDGGGTPSLLPVTSLKQQ